MSLLNCYEWIVKVGDSLQSLFLLAVRLFWGYRFFESGKGKLTHISTTAEYLQSLHIPFPELNAYISGGIECFGGLLLIIGLFSRLACIPLIISMSVAYLTADIEAVKNIYQDPINFIQRAPFTFLLAALIIFIFGPGKIALDYVFKRWVFKRKV